MEGAGTATMWRRRRDRARNFDVTHRSIQRKSIQTRFERSPGHPLRSTRNCHTLDKKSANQTRRGRAAGAEVTGALGGLTEDLAVESVAREASVASLEVASTVVVEKEAKVCEMISTQNCELGITQALKETRTRWEIHQNHVVSVKRCCCSFSL